MGLACANIRLLTLTARKAECEEGLAINAMRKQSLARDQSNLSQEYYSKLQAKNISYFANGQYNKISYEYLMGYGKNYTPILTGKSPLKDENSMILTDFNGRTVLNDSYAEAIVKVLGSSCVDKNGRGGTFSTDKIPEMLAALIPGHSAEDFRAVIDCKDIAPSSYETDNKQTITGEDNGNSSTIDNTESKREILQNIVDFYYPIFSSAAANGWTKEYNDDMKYNENYVNDALLSGTFQLAKVNEEGNYEPDLSLSYFVTAGLIEQKDDVANREKITAWYNAEKNRISEKESYIDIIMHDLSTELEAINAEIQSLKTLIENDMSAFEWGNN